jgi:hypothetical protein
MTHDRVSVPHSLLVRTPRDRPALASCARGAALDVPATSGPPTQSHEDPPDHRPSRRGERDLGYRRIQGELKHLGVANRAEYRVVDPAAEGIDPAPRRAGISVEGVPAVTG